MLKRILLLDMALFGLLIIGGAFALQNDAAAPLNDFAQYRRRVTVPRPDIDNFVAHFSDSKSRTVHGSLEVWDILTKLDGEPLYPQRKGAVLVDLNSVSYAQLKANSTTQPDSFEDIQQVWYINSGEGIVKASSKEYELHEGIGAIVPPGIEFSIHNTSDDPLTFYIIEEPIPSGFRPRKSIVIKYEFDNSISTNIRRVESDDWLFSREDGLAVLFSFNPVMYEPQSIVPPHVHDPGIEEVWIGVKGDMSIQVGRQRRPFPSGSAYKVPADGRTPHTNINGGEVSKKLLWMMKVPLPPGYDRQRLKDDMI